MTDVLRFLTTIVILAIHLSLAAALTAQDTPKDPPQDPPPSIAGPLVGSVTADTATLWMYYPTTAECTVSYWSEDADESERHASFVLIAAPAAGGTSRPARVTLAGLAPETSYRYRILVDRKSDPAWSGSFRTPPEPRKPSRLRVALTSCMKIGQPQASWYLLLAQQPDLHITVGDTHYADTTEAKAQWEHHVRYRNVPQFATVIRHVPTLAIWDDHDYGPNDSDGTAAGKEASLAGWKQFWANPPEGSAELPGAFFRYSWGEVDFFVVDGRYHRSPDKDADDEKKRMLGDDQFAWLLDGLRSSRAKFKAIVSGSTLDHSTGDGWRIYTHERRRLFDAVKEHAIAGVVYLSGDIHRSLVWEHHESNRVGYPLVEVVSSGIANSSTLSFATIDFDTTLADPTMRVRIIHGDGTVRDDRTWRLSGLGGF